MVAVKAVFGYPGKAWRPESADDVVVGYIAKGDEVGNFSAVDGKRVLNIRPKVPVREDVVDFGMLA